MVLAIDKPQLNSQQAEAVEKLKHLLDNGQKIVGLYGTAGTGKTFAAAALLEVLPGKVLVVAPTNTAVKQLRKSLAKCDRKVGCMTVAKALGRIPDFGENGEMVFVDAEHQEDTLILPFKVNDLETIDFLVVDEASMLARKNLEELISRTKPTCQILILMDKYQLPPVGEKEIYAEKLVGENFYQLTKTERYREDSYIYQVITAAREGVIKRDRSFNPLLKFPKTVLDVPEQNHGYHVRSRKDALWGLVRANIFQRKLQRWDYVRCVCWTNAEVEKINTFVRNAIWEGWAEGQSYIPGEILMTTGAVQRQEKGRIAVLYPTNTNLIVLEAKQVTIFDREHEEFKAWQCLVEDPDDTENPFKKHQVILIDQYDRDRYYSKLEILRKSIAIASQESGYQSIPWKAALGKFKQFVELIDPIRHGYAITAHGSQGTSLNMSYVNVSNIMTNRMDIDVRLRCLFVGMSRARNAIVVF